MNRTVEFLIGGGEMRETVLATNWSATPLGAIETWPQSLRTTVSLCLASNFPFCLIWGLEHVQIYNDGYRVICEAKHPACMGQDFTECWASAWPTIGEAFERALKGETSFLENQRMFLDRNGYLEETFFTFSFSPIRDEVGEIAGLFHPVTETTAQMLSERRTRALRDLADRAGKAKTVSEACDLAIKTLSEHPFDLPFVLFYLLDADQKTARLANSAPLPEEIFASLQVVDLDNSGTSWPFSDVLRSATTQYIDKLQQQFHDWPSGPYPECPQKAALLPIFGSGTDRAIGVLVAGVSPRLPFDDVYRGFYDLLGAAVTAVMTNARAYEEERKRAEVLAELDRAKTTFFSNVSHEFRTPLTLMLGPLEEVLAQENNGHLAPKDWDQLKLAHRNSLRLLKLVNTLLDFSRIEAGRVQALYEPVDLSALTRDLASVFRSVIEKARLRFLVDCPPLPDRVYVDRGMWEKVVFNLLSNAFKFTFHGEIRARLQEGHGGVVFSVSDTGIGIPAKEIPYLFERFHRVEGARGRTHEGTGIGLALVAELVKLHGGTVYVESEMNAGSTFFVTLPYGSTHLPQEKLAPPSTAASLGPRTCGFPEEAVRWLPDGISETGHGVEKQREPVRGPSPRGRILLADDNADMRLYLQNLLAPDYEVDAVTNGAQALRAVQQRLPDLVISDVMMPELDGFALLAELRKDKRTQQAPVLLLSARAGEESRIEGLDAGADDYLVKPFSALEFLARVRANIELAQLRQKLSRESEVRFQILSDSDVIGLSTWDLGGHIHWANDAFLSMVEYSRADLETGQMDWAAMTPPESMAATDEALRQIKATGRFEPFEKEFFRKDGTRIPILIGGASYTPGKAIAFLLDLSERKKNEQAVRESEARLRFALQSGQMGGWELDLTTHQAYHSLEHDRIFGYQEPVPEWNFDTFLQHVMPEDRELVDRMFRSALERGEDWDIETRIRRVDGEVRWVWVRGYHNSEPNQPPRLIGIVSDITERKLVEERLREAAKLESVGVLAGGIAHDFNNLLTGILGNASLALEFINGSHPLRNPLREIVRASERAAGLTRQMLAYSGRATFVLGRMDLSELVRETIALVHSSIPRSVTLDLHVSDRLPPIDADIAQMQQLVMNLIINAAEAVGDKPGIVTVATSACDLDSEYLKTLNPVFDIQPGSFVCLEVQDSGCGMEPATLGKIFDPFFTTKVTGRGLGLSAVLGIVRGHRGSLKVYSESGRGTLFKVLFPVAAGEAVRSAAEKSRTIRGAGTILVVEDDEAVEKIARALLEHFGFHVLSAVNGQEAVDLFRIKAAEIDAVLLDMSMPVMDGETALPLLLEIRPDARIILSSGFSEMEALQRFQNRGVTAFLQKPYSAERLKTLLAQLGIAHEE